VSRRQDVLHDLQVVGNDSLTTLWGIKVVSEQEKRRV
jgi:hypothetical protein